MLPFRLFVAAAAVLVSAPLAAATASMSFFAKGRARSLEVERDYVAVRSPSVGKSARPKILNEREAARFAEMGLSVVPRATRGVPGEVVGYPVWFNRGKGAVGVLTREIVVKVRRRAGERAVRATAGFSTMAPLGRARGLFKATFSSPTVALAAANALSRRKDVAYAHPNFWIPKDWRESRPPRAGETYFQDLWHLENNGQFGGLAGADIHVKAAWEVTEGDPSIVVAILDGGFETSHPDLDLAFFRNPREIIGNGVDDDDNGYVDDVSGWNFWTDAGDASGGLLDLHGTAVAGLVGARKNGQGVVGTCPSCTLLPIAVSWEVAEDAAAFHYASALGADVITNSWGYPIGTPETDVVVDAIHESATTGRGGKGAIILFAMNNSDQDDCVGPEPDLSAHDDVVAVSGASDLDVKVTGSAWGDCMEILAPTREGGRKGVATTDLLGKRGYNAGDTPSQDLVDLAYTNDFGGTSAATPIAAGVFGLMLAVNGGLTRNEAVAMVLATADKIRPELAAYNPRTGFSSKYGYGRINAARAVGAAQLFRQYSQRDKVVKMGQTMRQ